MKSNLHQDEVFDKISFSEKEAFGREFDQCTFRNCDLSENNFSGNRFIDCTFSNCNLSMIKLRRATLNNVTFTDCKILGVNFGECEDFLFTVKFEKCILDYASFMKRKMPKTKFANTSLKQVNFEEAVLNHSMFGHCDLEQAVFNNTQLTDVDFSTAINLEIDPERNNLHGAKFSTTNLLGLLTKYNIKVA